MFRKILFFCTVVALMLTTQISFSQVNILPNVLKQQTPVSYIENRGQWPAEVRFMAQLRGMNVWMTTKGLKFDVFTSRTATADEVKQEKSRLRKFSKKAANNFRSENAIRRSGQVIDMELVGSSASKISGSEQQIGYRNYFIGKNPTLWQTNVPVFSKLRSEEVYPGIDAIYTFQDGKPRYDFVVKPGANPALIAIRFSGANSVNVSDDKGIELSTKLGDMYNGNIYAYQQIGEHQVQIPCKFDKQGDIVKFAVGNYDSQKPLVIDPLVYSTYFGGSGSDEATGVSLDNFGNVVVTGGTNSPNYPSTKGAYDTTSHGGMDVFIAKFDKTTTTLLYSTYIGGGSDDKANAVAIDVNSNAIFVCGETSSVDMPAFGWKTTLAGGYDAFVAKISADGKTLDYCTYAGGGKDDRARAIAVGPGGEACVAGETFYSTVNFPVSTNAYKKVNSGLNDAFVMKLRSSGNSVAFSTYMGGTGDDYAYAVGSDLSGAFVYVAGSTANGLTETYPKAPKFMEPGFPDPDRVPHNYTFNSGNFTDGWVAKINDAGAFSDYNNQYITYLGASKNDRVRSLSVQKDGSVLVAGETEGGTGNKGFPSSNTSVVNKGGLDVFVSKLSYNGRVLISSTMFGGAGNESAVGISVSDKTSDVFVVGQTTSQDFQMSQLSPPILPIQANLKGAKDAFMARLPAGLEKVAYATYFGGKGDEGANAVAATPRGDAYMVGYTNSDDLDVFSDEYQPTIAGGQDGFISKIAFGALNLTTPNDGTFCPGQSVTIRWTKAEGLADGDSVEIQLSSNGGASWYTNITPKPVLALSYVWNIPANLQPGIAYKLRLMHSSGVRTETSSEFTIGTPVQILENPVGDSVCPGTRVRLRVKGLGENLTYKWYFNNTPINGANADTLVIPSVQSSNAGSYKVDVSAGCTPATSQPITLVVKPATKVIAQPQDKTIPTGGSHTFKITAQGNNLTYEWFVDGSKILNATSNEYTITSANAGQAGKYKVIVRGECGIDTSKEAILTVDPVGVYEQSGTSSTVNFTLLSEQPASDELTTAITSVTGCSVDISLFDNLGSKVMSIYNGALEAGISRVVSVDVKNLSSGIYWLTAKCGSDRTVQKVEIVR